MHARSGYRCGSIRDLASARLAVAVGPLPCPAPLLRRAAVADAPFRQQRASRPARADAVRQTAASASGGRRSRRAPHSWPPDREARPPSWRRRPAGVERRRAGRRERLRNAVEGWDPRAIRRSPTTRRGRLWFASSQGSVCAKLDGAGVSSTERAACRCSASRRWPEHLTARCGSAPARGAVRIAARWRHRVPPGPTLAASRRIRAVTVDADGTVWFDTAGGRGGIEARPTTLAAKAAAFEDAIDRHHRRTPYGYVVEAHLKTPGDPSDGLHDRQRQRRLVDRHVRRRAELRVRGHA